MPRFPVSAVPNHFLVWSTCGFTRGAQRCFRIKYTQYPAQRVNKQQENIVSFKYLYTHLTTSLRWLSVGYCPDPLGEVICVSLCLIIIIIMLHNCTYSSLYYSIMVYCVSPLLNIVPHHVSCYRPFKPSSGTPFWVTMSHCNTHSWLIVFHHCSLLYPTMFRFTDFLNLPLVPRFG